MSFLGTRITILCTALFMLTLVAVLPAQKLAVPQHVPSDVKAIISINDAGKMWAGLGQTPLRRQVEALLAHPSITASPDYQDFTLMLDKASLDLGYSLKPDQFFGPVLKGVDLYVVQPTGQPEQYFAAAKFAEPAQATAFADYIRKHIAQRSETLQAQGGSAIQLQESDVSGLKTTSATAIGLHFGTKGDLLIASSSQQAIQSAMESPGAERLTAIPEIAAALDKLGSDGEIFYYINGKNLQTLTQMVPDPRVQAQNLSFGTSAGVASFAPSKINLKYYTASTEAPAAATGASMSNILKFVGLDPLFGISVNNFDPQEFNAGDDQMLATSMPAVSQAMETLRQFEQQLGISFDEDVAPAFGPDAAFFLNNLSIMNITSIDADMLVILGVKDEAKARKVMSALEKSMHTYAVEQARNTGVNSQTVQPVEETYKDVVIRSVPYRHPLINTPMGLAYGFSGNQVLISLNPQAVKTAIDRSGSESLGLPASSSFAEAAGNFPQQYHQLMIVDFGRLGTTFGGLVPMLAALSQTGQQETALLVSAVDVVKSFGTMYSTTQFQQEGSLNHVTLLMK